METLSYGFQSHWRNSRIGAEPKRNPYTNKQVLKDRLIYRGFVSVHEFLPILLLLFQELAIMEELAGSFSNHPLDSLVNVK